MEHIINAQHIDNHRSRNKKRRFSTSSNNDEFGEIMASFIPAENPDGAISAEMSSDDAIITPPFPIHHVEI